MGRSRLAAAAVALVFPASSVASAQPQSPALELTASGGRLATLQDNRTWGGLNAPAFEVAVGVPFHRRFAVEGALNASEGHNRGRAVEGFYSMRVKHDLDQPDARLQPFFTYGVAGYYARGDAGRPSILTPPEFLALGTGLEKAFGRRLTLRVDLGILRRLVGLSGGARASAGVSFGFGNRQSSAAARATPTAGAR